MTITTDILDLQAHLADYARRVKEGDTIIVCEHHIPIGEFRPLPRSAPSQRPAPGLFRNEIHIPDSFFEADAELEQEMCDGPISTLPR